MPTARFSGDEVARRGQDLYERTIKPNLGPEDDGKFVAIDTESGDYEIDLDDYQALERLLSRRTDAQMWLMRAGRPTAYRIGAHRAAQNFG